MNSRPASEPYSRPRPDLLLGRDPEIATIAALLDAEGQQPAAVVFSGDAGIGKSSVVQAGIDMAAARGLTTLVARPSEMQAGAPFAVVTDLTAGLDAAIHQLPPPQRHALRVATLRDAALSPGLQPHVVAVALRNLLLALGSNGPLCVVLDDAHWIDEASLGVLSYAAGRLTDTPIRWFVAGRSEGAIDDLLLRRTVPPERLVTHVLGPLSPGAIQAMIRRRLGVRLPHHLMTRIADVANGNPFFAQELTRAVLRDGDLAPGRPLPVPAGPTELVSARVRSLDDRARDSLLLLAAMDSPSVDVVHAVGGADAVAALDAAESAGLIVRAVGQVRFEHPLVAAAAYADADAPARRVAHRQLAAVATDVETRARHLARAATDPEERLAVAIQAAADAADARGARGSAAELAELACNLTPPSQPDALAERRLALARRLLELGDLGRAGAAAAKVIDDGPPGPTRARARLVVAEIGKWSESREVGRSEAFAAREEPDLDAVALAEIDRFLSSCSYTEEESLEHLERAIARLRGADAPALLAELLSDRAGATFLLGRGADDKAMAEAIELEPRVARRKVASSARTTAAVVALFSDELSEARATFEMLAAEAAELGEENSLADLLAHLANVETRAGRWVVAETHARALIELADRMDRMLQALALARLGGIQALTGPESVARATLAGATEVASEAGWPFALALAHAGVGMLELALGHSPAAVDELRAATALIAERGMLDPGVVPIAGDLVEALIEVGELDEAADRIAQLEQQGRRLARPRAIGTAARAEALLLAARGEGERAVAAAVRATDTLAGTELPLEHARSLLVAGRVHRRARHKGLAHALLTQSVEAFDRLGARLWAAQARMELSRVGLRPSAPGHLTDTERRVAELVARGLTNRQVADAAFLTPRSVEGVLRRIYAKLGVSSRAQLAAVISAGAADPAVDRQRA